MKSPFLPTMHTILAPARRSARELLEAQYARLQLASLSKLARLFEPWLPAHLIRPTSGGPHSRMRIYSLPVTFWAFLAQVLSPGSSCREIVHKVQAWCAHHALPRPSSRTGAYCRARQRLDYHMVLKVFRHIVTEIESRVSSGRLWLGHRVLVADGTCLSMSDTPANQHDFPQSSNQKPGLGFPVLKLVGLFSLASGALLDWAEGNKHIGEANLWRSLWDGFKSNDVILADRAFCSYATFAALRLRNVSCVMRLNQSFKEPDFSKGKQFAPDDALFTWIKPLARPHHWSHADWQELPEKISVRIIKVTVKRSGFRTRSLLIATTLTDPIVYSAQSLAELYFRRWTVELFFRDIKMTTGMDILRCKSPGAIRTEILFHLIAYNLIRALMQHAAALYAADLDQISFAGAVSALRQWSPFFVSRCSQKKYCSLRDDLLAAIADDSIPFRPGRSEPRAKKRRPKNYHLLTSVRHTMFVPPHRNRPVTSYLSNP